jgi:hypothetical protein
MVVARFCSLSFRCSSLQYRRRFERLALRPFPDGNRVGANPVNIRRIEDESVSLRYTSVLLSMIGVYIVR